MSGSDKPRSREELTLRVNQDDHTVFVDPDTPLLWVLRDTLGLMGTKFGCGVGRCGACTVHLNGKAVRSCTVPVSKAAGKAITTIEGLSPLGNHPVQEAWVEEDVPQCGYCHSGQVMAAAALLAETPEPTDAEIDRALSGNICRCGTYQRIRKAVHRAAELAAEGVPSRTRPGPKVTLEARQFALNPFVRLGTDGWVTLVVPKSEMGQGVYTSLPMLLAEELECDWSRIRLEAAPVAPVYRHTQFGLQLTGGSTSVWSEWERLGRAGAEARERLVAAAAALWKADPATCRAEGGRVIHPDGREIPYGELAERASAVPAPEEVRLKDPSSYRLLGKPTRRLDSTEKVDGTGVFGLDVRVPEMLTALIARPPVFGAEVAELRAEKARAVPGVVDVLEVPAGVAVLATGFWPAKRGREALEVTWDEGPNADLSTAGLRERYAALAEGPGVVARMEGDPDRALAEAERRLEAEYEVPYLAHAPMEPLNCLVDLSDGRCEIWTGTQSQTTDRDAAAAAAGLDPDRVRVHTTLLGGGFGRRANPRADFVTEAVQVAKAAKKPVKVVWTREDDIRGGFYRPFWYDRLAAGLDGDGNPVAWEHTIVGQSILVGSPFEEEMVKDGIDAASVEGAADIPYAIPNLRIDLHTPEVGVPVQWWRSVGHSHTAFVVESFIDELAHAAGQDPLAFRRRLLRDQPRLLGVVERAAQEAGWGEPPPEGRARGIAVHESFGSFVAQVAEVSADPEGQVTVHRVVCAVDCGRVANPLTVTAQMEGCVVFGLTAALKGAVTFEGGRVRESNFHDYEMLRLKEMPRVDVHIVASDEAPGGVGEPGVPPAAPALTNALFAATGVRIRRLPVSGWDLGEKARGQKG